MDPVVTPEEMAAIDAAAPEPVEELIDRAGRAVAAAALELLPRTYGSRVVIIAGKGNNGADGRAAATVLARRGVGCTIVPPHHDQPIGPDVDLILDAAFGTGFRGTYEPPEVVGDVPVLAVDIPSGVDGLTGDISGRALAATATITFAALKPGLLLGPGRQAAGPVTVADIGLDCSRARAWHLGPGDVTDRWPVAGPAGHKWQRAVWVIGGHPLMPGAPALAARAAARAGAGYVTVSVPGAGGTGPPFPAESVFHPVPAAGGGADWGDEVLAAAGRHAALVVGPGLDTGPDTGAQVRTVIGATGDQGLVLDGGALDALIDHHRGGVRTDGPSLLGSRPVPAVLTPHDGELARLLGGRPGADRLAGVRVLAADLGAVVLAKGPATVAAHPDGRVLVSTAGDQRLATAGTGDVLAGLVGAALAGGLEPLEAAAVAAELHGRAAGRGRRVGLVAGDLPGLVADWLDERLETAR
jgi:NAD(P)H-hydrate epimerase